MFPPKLSARRSGGRAKSEGLRITAETCPHYLFFTSSSIPDRRTEFKCAPPIRDQEDCRSFGKPSKRDVLDQIASDHAPSPPALKCRRSGDFLKAWGGISSLQLGLPIVWTKIHAQDDAFERAGPVDVRGAGEAHAGLDGRKGALAAGYDADLVVWNPEKRFTVRPKLLQHRHKLTPYAGQSLLGAVEATFLRGEMIYDRGRFIGKPRGALLRRGEH